MRLWITLLLSLVFSSPVWSSNNDNSDALLNKITLKLNAEQWVSSKTALVTIGVNASVSDNALDKVQDNVLQKLNTLSNQGEWHITSFNRSLDQSGLERVQMSAQARLPASALPNLRDKTKTMSKPGETYTLDDVQFIPSEDEIRAANINLRGLIYQQAKDELVRLNHVYSDQKYYVHDINFVGMVYPMAAPQNAMTAMLKMGDNVGSSSSLAVGDKLILSAVVVLASNPDVSLTKVAHS